MSQNKSSSSKENTRPARSRAKASKTSSHTPQRAPLQDHNPGESRTVAQGEEPPGSTAPDETTRIRELEGVPSHPVYSVHKLTMPDVDAALLRETQTQLRATEARLQDAGDDEERPATRARDDPIDIPSRLTDVTMGEIRGHLGYDKPKWRALRVRQLYHLCFPPS